MQIILSDSIIITIMTKSDVFALLEENKNQKGIDNWDESKNGNLHSYGLGLTALRKMAKKIGRDSRLAADLWDSDCHDARIISLLIDDPKTITREQAESQVEQLEGGYLAHVFSSCDATLGKAPFVRELADEWIQSSDAMRRCCGYGLLYELSKSKKKSAPSDGYFHKHLEHIEDSYQNADVPLLMSMGTALLGIGKRNLELHAHALRIARLIGPVDFNQEGQNCDPMDVAKNLTSDAVLKMMGLA